MRNLRPVLLLEDDMVDAMTVKRALKDLKVNNPLVRVINGEEALKYLRDENNIKPCVMLLALNMPRLHGVEFLKIAKTDPKLRGIPVVVLTTSKADQDRNECFNRSVAGYIVKPVDYKNFLEAMRVLDLYWTLSEMPPDTREKDDIKLENALATS